MLENLLLLVFINTTSISFLVLLMKTEVESKVAEISPETRGRTKEEKDKTEPSPEG